MRHTGHERILGCIPNSVTSEGNAKQNVKLTTLKQAAVAKRAAMAVAKRAAMARNMGLKRVKP